MYKLLRPLSLFINEKLKLSKRTIWERVGICSLKITLREMFIKIMLSET